MKSLSYSDALRDSFLFAGIALDTAEKYLSELKVEISEFSCGDIISGEGINNNAFGVLLKGSAAVASSKGGGSALRRNLGPGDIFGAAAVFLQEDSCISKIVASTRAKAAFISADSLRTLIFREPLIAINYIVFLSDRVKYLNRKIDDFTAGDAESRLMSYLTALETDDSGGVQLPVSFSKLAGMLDISRASLYRVLDDLEGSGDISRDGKQITVLHTKCTK